MSMLFMVSQASLFAETITFPKSKGDIASPADWGRTEDQGIPAATDLVLFNQGGGAYTASADVSFATLLFQSSSTFTMSSSDRTVRLSGGLHPNYKNSSITLKSGLWDFKGTGPFSCVNGWSTACGCTITLSDGAIVTNVSQLTVGRWSSSTLNLTGVGTALFANDYFSDDGHGGKGFYNDVPSRLNILDGAKMVCANFGWSGGEALISGTGSELYCPSGSGISFGKNCNNVSLRVTDGGTYRSDAELLFPADGTTGVLIDVGNCATGRLGTVYFGNYAGSSGNGTIRVGKGGYLSFGTLRLYGTNDRLVVSNGAFQCSNFYFGGDGKTTQNCEFHVTGPDASLNISSFASGALFSTAGTGNAYTFGGCSTNTFAVQFFSSGANGNRLNVIDGARLNLGAFLVKNYSAGRAIDDNAILIANGAEMRVDCMSLSGLRNVIVVSNATLKVSNTEGLTLGATAQDGAKIGTNTLVVAGATPSVEVKRLYLNNDSKVVWRVPPEGYADGAILLTTDNASGDNTVLFEIEGLEDWQKNNEGVRQTVTLMRATNGALGGFTSEMLDVLKQKLPKGCTITLDKGNTELNLHLGTPTGLLLLVR